ncbi:MAG: hypothetical protein LJF04_12905 [Gemmatimonadetes bacterium]|nr:hypothetical protein [Gemmatimonadota bacterium]
MTGPERRRLGGVVALSLSIALAVASTPIRAQQRDSIPGVALGLMYETVSQPALGIKPFTGRFGGAGVAPQVEAIIGRDLHNSDRFEVMDSLPASMGGEGVDYELWDRLGAVWLVTGQVEGAGDGLVLLLELHDVVYSELKQQGRFPIPDPSDPGFRMAVHRASDQIVEWVTGEPGVAATRIAFGMRDSQGNKDIYTVDSDGENLQRITDNHALSLSPAWSPDASHIAYSSDKGGTNWRIYELNLTTQKERMIPPPRPDANITPAYLPDGHAIAFAVTSGTRSGIYTYDLDNGGLANLTGGRYYDISPTFSPDGKWMAFNTDRFGTTVPQIMVMPMSGGDPQTLSPYQYGKGGYYTSPDWSPRGNLVAFHGRIRLGTYHILVADMKDAGHKLKQLTWEGNNEDPTWAPDGRHIAFVGERRWGFGLMVVDISTGRLRTVIAGRKVSAPAWSPSLNVQR